MEGNKLKLDDALNKLKRIYKLYSVVFPYSNVKNVNLGVTYSTACYQIKRSITDLCHQNNYPVVVLLSKSMGYKIERENTKKLCELLIDDVINTCLSLPKISEEFIISQKTDITQQDKIILDRGDILYAAYYGTKRTLSDLSPTDQLVNAIRQRIISEADKNEYRMGMDDGLYYNGNIEYIIIINNLITKNYILGELEKFTKDNNISKFTNDQYLKLITYIIENLINKYKNVYVPLTLK